MAAADEADICALSGPGIASGVEQFPAGGLAAGISMHACLVASLPVALCLIDRQARFAIVNDAMARILGQSVNDLTGSVVSDRIVGARELLEKCFVEADGSSTVRRRIVPWLGRLYRLSFSPVTGPGGGVHGLTVVALDQSGRARFKRRMRDGRRRLVSIAQRDDLTGIFNRRGLDFKLGRMMRRGPERPVALLVVDIDRFKAYNDGLGHAAGDQCLRAVAGALGGYLRRATDLIGRYGGDEFLIALPDMDRRGAVLVAEECRQAIENLKIPHPAAPGGFVTVSIGLTDVFPERAMGLAELGAGIEEADRALYRAKEAGRNRVRMSGLGLPL